jgi:hypothetical protein
LTDQPGQDVRTAIEVFGRVFPKFKIRRIENMTTGLTTVVGPMGARENKKASSGNPFVSFKVGADLFTAWDAPVIEEVAAVGDGAMCEVVFVTNAKGWKSAKKVSPVAAGATSTAAPAQTVTYQAQDKRSAYEGRDETIMAQVAVKEARAFVCDRLTKEELPELEANWERDVQMIGIVAAALYDMMWSIKSGAR